ncbi:TetR family transcriptional regulator [Gordonia sp. PDNC005]|uniref:TetR/AcrR family transcriptional regulator n=1 Tax=unclassified Gordonia (in: high G+C Gram-positive bacteria) TaxID=2657482 RepID=UPI0019647DF2|nr:TetR family transcriptional regulator [Gordonia sp. PDNC005]QRY62219.1 TetR family transcriptional regulator [Gordonia sp. PDNC005]
MADLDTDVQLRRPYAPRMGSEERREQLLDAVLRVIVERGVHKVSIESVASEAGVTRPVVYKHFGDSADLLNASLRREEARALAQCSAAVTVSESVRGSSSIALVVYGNLLRMFEDSPDLWRAVLQLADSATPAFRRTVERGREEAATRLAEVLRAHAADRGPEADRLDVDVHARMMVALVIESGRLLLSRPEEYTRERLVAAAGSVVDKATQ